MFIEINDISTGTLVIEPLNVYSIDYVYKKTVNSKYRVIFKLNNGLVKEEEFDTESEADNRIDEIKEISPGGGGGGGSYVLPIASATRLGGVKVGENLSIDNNGVLSATSGSGSEVLTLDMSEVATTEVMYALINGQSPININVTEQSHPTAFQELTDVFEDSRFGSANLNVLISNDILNNIIIPAESNLGSQFVTPAISAITTFGISTYLSIQINQSSNNLYIVGLAVDAFADKQDALVSGTNIKTINNESILGSGNLDIAVGLTYKGILPKNTSGNSITNLATLEPGIYYGHDNTRFSIIDNPGASKIIQLSNYGVYIRQGYLFILNKAVDDTEVNEAFAIIYGISRSGGDIIAGIVTFTKKENTAGFSVSQSAQTVTNVVDLTTNQIISSTKTFNTIPECSVVPSADNHLVNKKYVDDAVATQMGTVSNQLSQI